MRPVCRLFRRMAVDATNPPIALRIATTTSRPTQYGTSEPIGNLSARHPRAAGVHGITVTAVPSVLYAFRDRSEREALHDAYVIVTPPSTTMVWPVT